MTHGEPKRGTDQHDVASGIGPEQVMHHGARGEGKRKVPGSKVQVKESIASNDVEVIARMLTSPEAKTWSCSVHGADVHANWCPPQVGRHSTGRLSRSLAGQTTAFTAAHRDAAVANVTGSAANRPEGRKAAVNTSNQHGIGQI